MPFQYALSTRAGAESLARALRVGTELAPRATVLSVDGVGAYDHAMLAGLLQHDSLHGLLPYARQFYGRQSEYLRYDGEGNVHSVVQGEGGEQGDPLMPALFALAQHPALEAVQASLQPQEALFAFLDDIYVVSRPEPTHPIFERLQTALHDQAER